MIGSHGIIEGVTAAPECWTCRTEAQPGLPPRERAYLGRNWRVAHAFGTALPGWMVVVPRRHVIGLDELTAAESAELGPLLSGLTAALREVVGCVKTYVALFAEADGFAHVHFHVIPRMPGQPAELRGPRVFGLLGRDDAGQVADDVRDQIATDVAAALARRGPGQR